MQVKRCTKCAEVKPLDEFGKDSKAKDGKFSWCKPCSRAHTAARRLAFPEKVAAERDRHRASGKHRETDRHRYAANPEYGRSRTRGYRERYPERVRDSFARWKAANPDGLNEAAARWRKANPDKVRDSGAVRRARERGVEREKVSVAEIIERDDSTCWMCCRVLTRSEVTLDHIIPLALGGPHTAANLKIACRPCNSRRGARWVPDFLKEPHG